MSDQSSDLESDSSSTAEITRPATETREKLSKLEYLHQYEDLRTQLTDEQDLAFKGEATHLITEKLDQLKRMYQSVQSDRIRDTNVHLKDSEAFFDTSKFVLTNARNINMDGSGATIDREVFLNRLVSWIAVDEYQDEENENENEDENDASLTTKTDWLKLGVLYHRISNKPIVSDSLNGPLATERRVVAPRGRNIDDTQRGGASSTARQLHASDLQGDQEQNTANMVKAVYEKYKMKETEDGVNFFKFFIDPSSFAQSIENLFLTSFLVKDSRIKLTIANDGEPILTSVGKEELQEAKQPSENTETRHHIASLDYNTWKYLVERYQITDSFLGHRNEEEDTIPPEDL